MKYLRPYNESFSSAKELEEALSIYEEELPFSMSNVNITIINAFKKDAIGVFNITYTHIDDSLKQLSNLREVYKKVYVDVDLYFKRFASKYDLTYKGCVVDIDVDYNAPSGEEHYPSNIESIFLKIKLLA